MAAMRALRAAGQRPGTRPRRAQAFWGGRSRKEEKEAEAEADRAIAEKEERNEPSLICPPPRSRNYVPPENLQSFLESHVREIFGPSLAQDWQQTPLQESRLKYHLLARLAAELGHAVPNSQLHQMRRAGDSKFDELAAAELPPNLKIMWKR
uniref:Large ribosomal subunit protein mL50 n=1 Tax=Malurus cyaneus samueli TaxID=2593467 RepID=A0A8C5UES5_9PASS